MQHVSVKDKEFRLSISADQIQSAIARVAAQIDKDFTTETPLFLAVLNGSFMFAADLMRALSIPSEIAFVKLSSYDGMTTTGHVRELIGLGEEVRGRRVIILEDIVDTGLTMQHMISALRTHDPKSIDICTLLMKPEKLQVNLDIKYCALEIPNDFIVGYGLDYDGLGRGLADIYTVVSK